MEIDRKTLKALAADTRLDILKSLSHRRKMPSELSKELSLAPSTVIEHLERLEEADLIRRVETGHKWIYYSLTEKGESLVRPKIPVQFVIVLSISIIVIAAGFVYINNTSNYAALAPSKGFDQPNVGQAAETGGTEGTKTFPSTVGGITGQINVTPLTLAEACKFLNKTIFWDNLNNLGSAYRGYCNLSIKGCENLKQETGYDYCNSSSNSSDYCDKLLKNQLTERNDWTVRGNINLLYMIKEEYFNQLDKKFYLAYGDYYNDLYRNNSPIFSVTDFYEICIYNSSNVMFAYGGGHKHCYSYFVYIIPKLTDSIENLIKSEYLNEINKEGYVENNFSIEDDKIILRRTITCS